MCQFGGGGVGELSHSASPKALLSSWRGQGEAGDVWVLVWVPAAMFITDIAHMLVEQRGMFSQKCLCCHEQ